MKKLVLYAFAVLMIAPGLLCTGNYIYSLTSMDPHRAFSRGQYRDAIRAFRRVLEKNPDDLFSRISLAMTFEAAGMPTASLNEYKQAVLSNSDSLIAGLLAADLLVRERQLGDPGQREWLNLERGFNEAMERRGAPKGLAAYYHRDEIDEYVVADALEALARQLDEDPNDATSYVGMGLAHWAKQPPDVESARKQFQRALALAPNDPLANFGLIAVERFAAEQELKNGESPRHLDAMMDALREAIRQLPESAVPIAALYSSPYTPYLSKSRLPQARAWARKHSRTAIANYLLAWVLAENSRRMGLIAPGWDDRAREPLKRARSLAPRWKVPAVLEETISLAEERMELMRQSKHPASEQ